MADETKIESLSLEISSNSDGAAKGVEKLASTLKALKEAVDFDSGSVAALKDISAAVSGLSALNGLKISSSVPKQLAAIGEAVRGLYGIQTADVTEVAVSLKQLGDVGDISIGPVVNQLKKLPEAAEGLKSIDAEDFRERISIIASAVAPLSNLGKNNLTSYIAQLGKLPDIVEKLDDRKLDEFAEKIEKVTEAVRPLGTEMEKVSNGFSAFPTRIQRLVSQNERLTTSNSRVSRSYTDLHHMVRDTLTVLERGGRAVAQLIYKENEYIENINLFNVSMGEYAVAASEYAEKVNDIMGIDPSDWIRNQGIFMTLATGFGVAGDRASVMSQQLVQLGYDLSSFFNDSFANAMQKLQSGLAGELEPLRRWGFDLSQAKLQQTALTLGIEKNISAMTQAEKAELRYFAIMNQVKTAQGDMARTLDAPANAIRIFKSEMEQASRSIGSIFVPALKSAMPYFIATTKIVKTVADIFASIAGFEAPDFGGFELDDSTGDIADDLESATESAKELKRTLLGIDEINRLGDSLGSGAGDLGSSGGLDFELPTYDFLDGAVNSRVNEIVEEMKEWLGITEDIDSWAELMDTRFGSILKTVGLIGGGLLTWKIGEGLISGLKWLTQTLEGNLTLSVTGFTIEALGAYDIGKNGADLKNVLETVLGGAAGTLGLTLLGLKIGGTTGGLVGLTLGLGIALAVGAIAYEKGVKESYRENFWTSEAGRELLKLREEVEESWDVVKEIRITLKTTYDEYQGEKFRWQKIRELVEETFDLSELEIKTPEQIQSIKDNIEQLNSLNLGELQLTYDETAGKIVQTREEVEGLIEKQRQLALEAAAQNALTKAYEEMFDAMYEVDKLKKDQTKSWEIYDGERDKLNELKEKLEEVCEQYGLNLEGVTKLTDIGLKAMPPEVRDAARAYNEQKIAVSDALDEHLKYTSALVEGQTALRESREYASYFSDELDNLKLDVSGVGDSVSRSFSDMKTSIHSATVEAQQFREEMALNGFGGIRFGANSQKIYETSFYASGGFPEKGEMFIAREQGPELVGKIGGQTAVMNNGQIVQSVASGVRDANAEQNALLREQNSLLRKLLEKEFTASVSAQEIQRGMARSNRIVGKTVVPVG